MGHRFTVPALLLVLLTAPACRQTSGSPIPDDNPGEPDAAAMITRDASADVTIDAGGVVDERDGGSPLDAGDAGAPPAPDGGSLPCVDTEQFFALQVWGPVLSQKCAGCHSADGRARTTQLVFQPALSADALRANYEVARQLALVEQEGVSRLLLKPTGQLGHVGGNPLGYQEGVPNAEYDALQEFVRQAALDVSCGDEGDFFAGVELLGWKGTLRKTTLALSGRIPTTEELTRIEQQGETGFDTVVTALFDEPAFSSRLKEYFNDALLTDLYVSKFNNGNLYPATELLTNSEFSSSLRNWYNTNGGDLDATESANAREANIAIAREPVELIAYVVRNNRPFKEILTSEYVLVNPWSARSYGITDVTFTNPMDPAEWREGHFSPSTLRADRAGLLSSIPLLNRYPTTATNKNRARARYLYKWFLATDIMKLGKQPADTTAAESMNATTMNPSCVVCHAVMDPVAGGFQNYDSRGRYYPDIAWDPAIFPPGFQNELLPATTEGNQKSLHWLATRVVEDPRFAMAAVHHAYTMLTGRAPLEMPTDPADPNAAGALRAFQAQRTVFDAIRSAFIADGYNFKTIVRLLLKSPYWRAVSLSSDAEARGAELKDLGTARLLTPEMLERKITAVTGFQWRRNDDRDRPYLNSVDWYRPFYGGIDNNVVTTRITQPNTVMANVAARMANDVACRVAAFDFTKDASLRRLFPLVTTATEPEDTNGAARPTDVEQIRANIRYLHARILGEELAPGDAEEERTYSLFYETWKEGKQGIAAGTVSTVLARPCQASWDIETARFPLLPTAQQNRNDPNHTIRAWMAVLTYLLSDFSFLYE